MPSASNAFREGRYSLESHCSVTPTRKSVILSDHIRNVFVFIDRHLSTLPEYDAKGQDPRRINRREGMVGAKEWKAQLSIMREGAVSATGAISAKE